MNHTHTALLLLLAAASAGSCIDKDWDGETNPERVIWNESLREHNVISIQQLKADHAATVSAGRFARITTDSMLRATVICNDDGGNLTQQLILSDGDGETTGFIVAGVNQDALYDFILPGQEVLLSLKGLYIGGYGQNAQLGYPSKNAKGVERIGRMSEADFWTRVRLIGKPDPARIDTLDYADVQSRPKDQWAGCIVRLTGTVTPKSAQRPYLAPADDADTGNGVTTTIHVDGGGTLDLRTSTYADFARFPLKDGQRYTLHGVLSRYNSGWQLGLRTLSDIREAN